MILSWKDELQSFVAEEKREKKKERRESKREKKLYIMKANEIANYTKS
jgi:hypothetical protein